MKPDPRHDSYIESFAFPEKIGSHTLRAIGPSSLTLLRRTENYLLSCGKIDHRMAMQDPRILQALQEFIFLHAAPVPEAVRASRLPRAEFEDLVLEFCGDITLDDLATARGSFDTQTAAAAAVMVDPAVPPANGKRDPNVLSRPGSRAGSGRSAAKRAGRNSS